jgi:hypothetical protein
MANKNLHKAKSTKNDEFYTRFKDIDKEVENYSSKFKDKIVYCNCDDVYASNFAKYFILNFNRLGLRKLIVSGFSITSHGTGVLYQATSIPNDVNEGNFNEFLEGIETSPIDGDFRNEKELQLLNESDIVATNPPFSLLNEFITLMMEKEKQFLLIGNKNIIGFKNFFHYLKENRIWLGCNKVDTFCKPDNTIQHFGNIGWFTNLDHDKRHQMLPLDLSCTYKGNEEKYPKYRNYEAINIEKVSHIPSDYNGVMGVPITFLEKYCPEQFDLIGISSTASSMDKPVLLGEEFVTLYRSQGGTGHFSNNMYGVYYIDSKGKAKVPYGRIFIKRKN